MKANHDEIKRLLNTVKGQIDGLIKMVDNDEYCIKVSNQVQSSIAILKKVNIEILDEHLKCCVMNATSDKKEKMEEISEVLKKALK